MERSHLHLVSDATGETITSVGRACLVQFEGVDVVEHTWNLVRTKRQLEKVMAGIETNPGVVLFTLVNNGLRSGLEEACRDLQVPCVSILDPAIAALSTHLGVKSRGKPGLQHAMDAEYFNRIDAINFVLAHDDGQLTKDIEDADVVLVGVSRTSKTPTSIYLANRGIKAANVPVVPGCPLPRELIEAAGMGECFVHGTGHGVGIEIHEAPRVASTARGILRAGDVVTVEPGVYLPGVGGVRIEDTVAVTDEGADVLTLTSKKLVL